MFSRIPAGLAEDIWNESKWRYRLIVGLPNHLEQESDTLSWAIGVGPACSIIVPKIRRQL